VLPPPARSTGTSRGTSTSTTELTVDLNADLGEGFGRWSLGDDAALLQVVSSANVACGFHAGDPSIMRQVCAVAAERGVAIGAHVSYRDLAGFGRRYLAVPPAELTADVLYQIGALQGIARTVGGRVGYVKAHGALYNRAHGDPEHAAALIEAVGQVGLPVLCQPGSETERLAGVGGVPVVREAFADRGYQASGELLPRGSDGALLQDPAEIAERAVRMVRSGEVQALDGQRVELAVQSLCVHGDGLNAVAVASAIRAALGAAGITVRPFTT
jgi:UPF0271 protein